MPGAVPTDEDVEKMSAIVEDGLRAGALGFSTSRTVLHRSIEGELVPGTTATAEELIAIGRAMGRVGYGVFEMASDLRREWNEFDWMGTLSRETGLPSPSPHCNRSPRSSHSTSRSPTCAPRTTTAPTSSRRSHCAVTGS